MRSTLLMSAAAIVALSACSNSIANANEAVSDGNVATSDAGAPQSEAMGNAGMANDMAMAPMNDQNFADTMAASDQFEIQSSQMVAAKGSRADVKSFAKMLIADHTKSTDALKAAAAKSNPPVEPAPALTAEQTSNLEALKAEPAGGSFDTLYLTQQVPAHEKALATLKAYAASGANPNFKTFATKTQTPVAMHLDKARSLQK